MVQEKVLQYIKRNKMLKVGEGVLVAVSGGPDSICLLHILKSLQRSYQLRLVVIHINHLLRGEEAQKDERYVRDLCLSWNIPFYGHRKNIKEISEKRGISIEEAGREVRYHSFYKMKEKHHLQKIALGQHRDDNAETIVMRLIRGTGPKGLAGIPPCRKDGVIRPLLSSSRKEIEEYCTIHKLFPRIDQSNLQPIYFRNKLRLEVIPYLEKYNGNLKKNLHHMSEIIREQQEYIDNEMEKMWQQNASQGEEWVILSMEWLMGLSSFEQKEMLRRSIGRVKKNLKEIEYSHIQLIVEKIKEQGKTTWTLQLPQGMRVERQYQQIIVKKEEKKKRRDFQYHLPIGDVLSIPEINMECNIYLEKREEVDIMKNSSYKAHFDFEKVGQELLIRNRRQGDVFRPVGSNGRKKLKDYFIDLKIPRGKREEIPIISSNQGIIWVVGYRIDEEYKIDENTKTVVTIECIQREEKNNEK